jgi:predicted small metal-binding protein
MKLDYKDSKLVAVAESLQDIKTLLALGETTPAVSREVATPTRARRARAKGNYYQKVGRPHSWPTCQTCGVKFRSYAALREHMKAAHNVESNIERPVDVNKRRLQRLDKRGRSSERIPLPCPICGEVFIGYKALANHMRSTHKLTKVQLASRGIFLSKRSGEKAYRPGVTLRPTTNYLEDNTAEVQAAIAREKNSFIGA